MSLHDVTFNALVQKHKDQIFGYSLSLLGSAADAEEITQEVLVRVWKHWGSFNPLAARSWIMKTTRNLCMDSLRRRRNTEFRSLELDDSQEETNTAGTQADNPRRSAQYAELADRIQAALLRLPETQRSAFVLREMHGLKIREISRVLEMPANTVKVYIMRARLQLQTLLNDYAPEAQK